MASSRHLRTITFLIFALLASSSASLAQPASPVAEQLAKAYGIDSYGQIEAVRYTFNIEGPLNLSRSWVWEPKTGKITYEGKGKDGKPLKIDFVQSELKPDSPVVKDRIDWFFVNDNYWAFLPFHVYWDAPGADITDKGMQKLPLGDGSARLVVMQYSKAGYTPGDRWDLYLDPENRMVEMVYHRGDPKSTVPGLVTVTWAGYKKAGPLVFSTEHRGTADGKPLHLFFTNVAVKVAGSDNWIEAN